MTISTFLSRLFFSLRTHRVLLIFNMQDSRYECKVTCSKFWWLINGSILVEMKRKLANLITSTSWGVETMISRLSLETVVKNRIKLVAHCCYNNVYVYYKYLPINGRRMWWILAGIVIVVIVVIVGEVAEYYLGHSLSLTLISRFNNRFYCIKTATLCRCVQIVFKTSPLLKFCCLTQVTMITILQLSFIN